MGRIWVNQSGPPNTQNDAKNCPTPDPEPFASFGVFGGYSLVLSVLSVASLVASFSGNWCPLVSIRGSILFFLAKFLESGIGAQRIPERIEPKKGRCNGCCFVVNVTKIWRLYQLGESR